MSLRSGDFGHNLAQHLIATSILVAYAMRTWRRTEPGLLKACSGHYHPSLVRNMFALL